MADIAVSRRTVLKLSGAAATSTLLFGASPAQAAGRQSVYLGSYTSSGGRGIGVGSIDPATGTLTVASWLPAIAEPSWLDLSVDGRVLYAVSEQVPDGRVSAVDLRAATPAMLNSSAAGWGPAHLAVHPAGGYLFTALHSAGGIVVHTLGADGQVGAAVDVHHLGGGSHVHQVVVDPSGRWVLAVDLGGDAISVFAFSEGRLRPQHRLRLPAGSGPRHLAFHPNGRYAYVVNESNSTIVACAWRNGTLSAGAVRSTRTVRGGAANYPAEVVVAADGRHVYVTNRGENTVAVFAVAGAGLRLVGATASGGEWPRHASIDRTGRWLYVANQQSDEVVWFALDRVTGLPAAPIGRLAAAAVTQVRPA